MLDVLAKHHVPGTFFVIGAHVAESPGLVRDEIGDGDEVGIHTFTHDDLGTAPEWRRSLEFSQTQSAIAGATGISTPLLRPPYSSEPDAVDRLDWAAIQDAGKQRLPRGAHRSGQRGLAARGRAEDPRRVDPAGAGSCRWAGARGQGCGTARLPPRRRASS